MSRIKTVSLVALCLCLAVGVSAQGERSLALINPGFEGEYIVVPGGYAAPGWTTHYKEGTRPPLADSGGGGNSTRRPEFKPIDAAQYPNRVAEGERAQVAFAFYGIMDAAFSQQVSVEKDKDIQCSIQGHGWSTNTDDPNKNTGDVHVSLGIGAEGQTWPWEHGIEWTRYDWTPSTYRTYYSRVVTARSSQVTFFILVTNKWAAKHNDFYLDDADCWYVEIGGECPACPTPQPTQTPQPTPEPCPTCVPGSGACNYDVIRDIVGQEVRREIDATTWGAVR